MKPTLELLAVIVSLVTFAAGVAAWYSAAIVKRYAAQRDFEHLRRNYQQLSEGVGLLEKENDRRFDQIMLELKDLKGIQMAMYAKVGGENSMGWQRHKGE